MCSRPCRSTAESKPDEENSGPGPGQDTKDVSNIRHLWPGCLPVSSFAEDDLCKSRKQHINYDIMALLECRMQKNAIWAQNTGLKVVRQPRYG